MCPVCERSMVAYELEGIEIDRCIECGGTWLDAGELEQIAEMAGGDTGRLSAAVERGTAERRTRLRCPRCRRRLRQIRLGERRPVMLDRCPRAHGLWFDRGEMETLIREFRGGGEAPVAEFFADLYRHELDPRAKGE